jgi:hypothetical protein
MVGLIWCDGILVQKQKGVILCEVISQLELFANTMIMMDCK